jgi:hypothetical protein
VDQGREDDAGELPDALSDGQSDQEREVTAVPRDPTVRAKFNTYRFADYKEEMIKLLARVITVSLETVKITDAMRNLDRTNSEDKQ